MRKGKQTNPFQNDDDYFSEVTRRTGAKPAKPTPPVEPLPQKEVSAFRDDQVLSKDPSAFPQQPRASRLPFNAQPFSFSNDPNYQKEKMKKLEQIHDKVVKQEISRQSNNFFSPFQHKLGSDFVPKEEEILERERAKYRAKLQEEYERTLNNQRQYTIMFMNQGPASGSAGQILQFAGGQVANPMNPLAPNPYEYAPGYNPYGHRPQQHNPFSRNKYTEDTPILPRRDDKRVHYVAPDFFSQITEKPNLEDVEDHQTPRRQKMQKYTVPPRPPKPRQPVRAKADIVQEKREPKKWNSSKEVAQSRQMRETIVPKNKSAAQVKPSAPAPAPARHSSKQPQEGGARAKQTETLKQIKKKEKGTFINNTTSKDVHLIQMLERQVLEKDLKVTFEDIADLADAKSLLQQAILLPQLMPDFFKGIRRPWKGVLLFGPPGTGKTLLAKAISSAGKSTFFSVSASSLASKWKGQSEKMVRLLFEMARYYAPSIVFFDEIDALGSKRGSDQCQSSRKVKTQLLTQMDGTSTDSTVNVTVIAATNRPWDLDEALRRRLQKRIYIPLPTDSGRKQLFQINLKELKLASSVNIDGMVKKTKGYSGADINLLCREAALLPMRRKLQEIGGIGKVVDTQKFKEEVNVPLTMEDLTEAVSKVNRSVGKEDLGRYDSWMKEFGSI